MTQTHIRERERDPPSFVRSAIFFPAGIPVVCFPGMWRREARDKIKIVNGSKKKKKLGSSTSHGRCNGTSTMTYNPSARVVVVVCVWL